MRDTIEKSRQLPGGLIPSTDAINGDTSSHGHDIHAIENMGNLSLVDDHSVYTGSSHWVAILEEVSYYPEGFGVI